MRPQLELAVEIVRLPRGMRLAKWSRRMVHFLALVRRLSSRAPKNDNALLQFHSEGTDGERAPRNTSVRRGVVIACAAAVLAAASAAVVYVASTRLQAERSAAPAAAPAFGT